MQDKTKDYDAEPVEYCAKCYSLRIIHDENTDTDCCSICGSTDIATTTIDRWERLYEGRYGHKFVEVSQDPRKSLYFKMPLSELKTKLYNSKYIWSILYSLYPFFPKGLSKSESIIVLFDKLSKDNKLDDLRYMMYDYSKRNDIRQL